MPLLMCDLDNTLVDRAATFRDWARDLVAEQRGDDRDVQQLVEIDGDGFTPREVVATAIKTRFELSAEVPDLIERFREELAARFVPAPGVLGALDAVRAAGWSIVIVTNGAPTQEAKIRVSGLDRCVDGWCVSAIEGARKPEPLIFERAAAQIGHRLDPEDWMVGDTAETDVVGGHGVGVATAWVRRGRTWPLAELWPTIEVESVADAVDQILALGGGESGSGSYH